MGKLEFNQEIGLHNKFHVVATDVRTGVTQEAWAYNLILDQGFEKIFLGLGGRRPNNATVSQWKVMRPSVSSAYCFGGFIHVGNGSGPLNAARTTLYGYLGGISGELHDRGWNALSSTGFYSLKTSLPVGVQEYMDTIKEIGLASGVEATYLSTHAMLEDSEGKPVSITVGPYDQVTIYATTYISLQDSYGGKVAFVDGPIGALNFFASVFVGNSAPVFQYYTSAERINDRYHCYLGEGIAPIKSSDDPVKKEIAVQKLFYNSEKVTYLRPLKRIVFDGIRIETSVGNSVKGIREIGLGWDTSYDEIANPHYFIAPVFRSVLPIPGVWPGKEIEGEEVGTGNDLQDAFRTTWMEIVPNSEEIHVQGRSPELQIRGTDYSFTNISVPFGDNIGGYNYGVEGIGGTVTNINNSSDGNTGNYASIGASEMSGNSYTSEPGLVFHYPSINYTDKLRVYQGKTGANSIRAFKFQGSNDLENWTTVVNGELPNSTGWQEFSFAEVGYQYWRFIVNSSWGTNATVRIYELEWLQTKPQIKFTVPPESGAAITANYAVDYIPKDENHVLDISFTFSFKDANAE